MKPIELSIDLGSTKTSIHKVGSGLIVNDESRVVVMTKNNGMTLIESGKGVEKYVQKPTAGYQIVNTIQGGVVTNERAAICMLKDYISRCMPGGAIIKPRVKVLASVGMGMSYAEKKDVEKALYKAGVHDVTLIESPLAIAGALGFGRGHFIVDIGSSKTEIAIVGRDGIVSGCSVDIGGDKITKTIADFMVTSMSSTISFSLAERIKKELGTLYENNNMSMRVNVRKVGKQQGTESEIIHSKDIRAIIQPHVIDLLEIIYNMSFEIPSNIADDICNEGIVLCGGGSNLTGLSEFISKFMQMKVARVDDATTVVSRGGMYFLENNTDFARLLNLVNYK
ncbi:MAG: hypothetical protein HDT32_02495 [Clostridiales bacterium]|nr:hypothetical protein [Clostridiales bacterium]